MKQIIAWAAVFLIVCTAMIGFVDFLDDRVRHRIGCIDSRQ